MLVGTWRRAFAAPGAGSVIVVRLELLVSGGERARVEGLADKVAHKMGGNAMHNAWHIVRHNVGCNMGYNPR